MSLITSPNFTSTPCLDVSEELHQPTCFEPVPASPPKKKTRVDTTEENKENCHPGCAVTPTVLNDCHRLPNPCPLPTSFSKRVQKSLERGTLSGNAKLMFLREAFTFYYGICPNPLPHEYEMMCETLCNKYPELKDKLPVDEKKPWQTVKRQMSMKFRNLRRNSEPTTPTIEKEGKYKLVALANAMPATVSPKATKPAQIGEDDEVAYQRNTVKLIEEFQKKNSNNSLVAELLLITHKRRREFIHGCQERTVDLIEKFPFLASKKWVHAEFSAMVGQDAIRTMESRWLRYMPALLRLEDEDESEDASYKALHILDKRLRGTGIGAKSPAVFAEYAAGVDIDVITAEKTFPEPRLVIIGKGENSQGFIVAEKQILLEADGFNILEGMITLLASYYVFYVSYPKSGPAAGTLLFLQEVVLNEQAKVIRKPARYSSLINSVL